MPIIHARVSEQAAEYLEEWADAVGAPVEDIAGDCVERVVEDDVDDKPRVTVDAPEGFDDPAEANPRMSRDTDDAKTLSEYVDEVPAAWCVTLRIPDDTDKARKAYAAHPLYHAAVKVAARNAVGDPDAVDNEDVDEVLRSGTSYRIPVSLLSGMGHDPKETATALSNELDDVADGFDTGIGFGGVGPWP